MEYSQNLKWRLYTSQGYLWMSGKFNTIQVNEALNKIKAELYDMRYMDDKTYIEFLKERFDRIFNMPSAVK